MRNVKKRARADLRRSIRAQAVELGPTPESLRKVRRDVMLGLLERGIVTQEQMNAAEAIRSVWQAFQVAMSPVRALDGTSRGGGIIKSPLERISPKDYDRWRQHYLPWVARAKAVRCNSCVTAFHIVMDVVVENLSLRSVDRKFFLRRGEAVVVLRDALDLWSVRR